MVLKMTTDLQAAIDSISGNELATILAGLDKIEEAFPSYSADDLVQAADAIGSLFFIDQYERPDLAPVNDRAIEVLSSAGAAVVPYIIQTFENSDMKTHLSKQQINRIFDMLFLCLSDPHSAIRAKTIRTLGKMEKCGILNDDQCTSLTAACHRIVGFDEKARWDRAFIVRKEAQETLDRLSAN